MGEHQKVLHGRIENVKVVGKEVFYKRAVLCDLINLVPFVFDTIGGVMCAKLINLFSKEKLNPMLGAAGISAFPMASRVVAKMGTKEDPGNHLLMHAVGANVSGQIASAIVGGLIIGILGPFCGL
jgi:oxaloacetate decarboxylase beta subunit